MLFKSVSNSKIDQGLSIFTILTFRDQIEIIVFQFEPDLIDLNDVQILVFYILDLKLLGDILFFYECLNHHLHSLPKSIQ